MEIVFTLLMIGAAFALVFMDFVVAAFYVVAYAVCLAGRWILGLVGGLVGLKGSGRGRTEGP